MARSCDLVAFSDYPGDDMFGWLAPDAGVLAAESDVSVTDNARYLSEFDRLTLMHLLLAQHQEAGRHQRAGVGRCSRGGHHGYTRW